MNDLEGERKKEKKEERKGANCPVRMPYLTLERIKNANEIESATNATNATVQPAKYV